jgi:hypothetical protein
MKKDILCPILQVRNAQFVAVDYNMIFVVNRGKSWSECKSEIATQGSEVRALRLSRPHLELQLQDFIGLARIAIADTRSLLAVCDSSESICSRYNIAHRLRPQRYYDGPQGPVLGRLRYVLTALHQIHGVEVTNY